MLTTALAIFVEAHDFHVLARQPAHGVLQALSV
jgi:hypothetical protein